MPVSAWNSGEVFCNAVSDLGDQGISLVDGFSRRRPDRACHDSEHGKSEDQEN